MGQILGDIIRSFGEESVFGVRKKRDDPRGERGGSRLEIVFLKEVVGQNESPCRRN